jgi:hypothetical protein
VVLPGIEWVDGRGEWNSDITSYAWRSETWTSAAEEGEVRVRTFSLETHAFATQTAPSGQRWILVGAPRTRRQCDGRAITEGPEPREEQRQRASDPAEASVARNPSRRRLGRQAGGRYHARRVFKQQAEAVAWAREQSQCTGVGVIVHDC